MGSNNKPVQLVFVPTRWTAGIAWEWNHYRGAKRFYRFEFVIMIPVVSLSILITNIK